MSRTLPRRLALPTLLCLALVAAPMSAQRPDNDRGQHEDQDRHEGGPDRPIRVDCTHGGSIMRALERYPEHTDRITIEISGLCQEAVVISRKVLIRGTDPATDGITGPTALPTTTTALVNVHGVAGFGATPGFEVVRFEHLSITNSPNLGLAVNTAQLGMTDVTISGHINQAMLSFPGGSIYADHVRIIDNHNIGLNAAGGRINCSDCELTNNNPGGGPAAVSQAAGVAQLLNATITGRNGVQSMYGGTFQISGGTINVQTRAVNAQLAGQVQLQTDVQLTGSVVCSVQSFIDVRRGTGTNGFTQLSTASGGTNLITNGCVMLAGQGTTVLAGVTQVSVGAYVGTEGGAATTVRFNALSCSNGGKVTTTGGNIVVNNVPGIPAACGV
ncbi:MAG: hypothetical protein WCQ64_07755 [Acidobacteriota bacterium]